MTTLGAAEIIVDAVIAGTAIFCAYKLWRCWLIVIGGEA